jgi:two-component system, NtrC family, sensor kinase
MVVGRGQQTITLAYSAPDLKVDYQYLFLTFIGFLYLAIGLFTLFRGTRGESTLFFLLTLLAFVVYVYTPAGRIDSTYRTLWLIEEFARIFLPPLTLHFFLRFPRPLFSGRRLILVLYAGPVLLAIAALNIYVFGNAVAVASPAATMQAIDRLEMISFAVYFTLAFVALTYTYRTSPGIGERKQVKWIYLGMATGFIPFLILYLIPFIWTGANSQFTTLAILPLALIPLAFAVSILRYKLWDVEVVIKEVLAYTITFVFGMIAFSTVNLLLSRMIEEALALERNFLAFASGLLIAGVLVPMKSRVETLLEMVIYRETYRHRVAMQEFAEELGRFRDIPELLEMIRERLADAIRIDRTNLYLSDGESFFVYAHESGIPPVVHEGDFAGIMRDRPVVLDEPRLPDASEVPYTLLRAGYRYMFPLVYRSELKGILICGAKRGEEPLSRDDLNLIGSLTAPVALAIENSRLYSRLRRQIDEIRSLKEYNENIIESSSSAIAVVAADGALLTGNQAFWDLVAASPDGPHTIEELFPPYASLAPRTEGAVEMETTNLAGELKSISVTASPFNQADAPAGTTVLVIVDVSERARLRRELQEKERLAALGVLAAGIAHEVNTPLTGISSYAQLLLADTPVSDPRYAILKKMEQQTFRASHLVNNLLDFAANRKRQIEIVSLRDAILSTVSIHDEALRSKDVRVEVDAPDDYFVDASFLDLQQVLTNLLLNARDAVSPGGNIRISLAGRPECALLTVRDDGHGIPEALREEIFKPLVTTKKDRGGTGLGLAISDRIVRTLGGEIAAANNEEGGATFSILLPLSKGATLTGRPTVPCVS